MLMRFGSNASLKAFAISPSCVHIRLRADLVVASEEPRIAQRDGCSIPTARLALTCFHLRIAV